MDNRVSTVEARNNFGDLMNRAAYGKERLILTRRGKKLAAIIPVEDLEILEAIEDKIDLEEARKALAEAGEEGTVSWENIKKELGL
jgi:prevent-host-death family protein